MSMKKLMFITVLAIICVLSGCGSSDIGIIGGADGPTEIIVSE